MSLTFSGTGSYTTFSYVTTVVSSFTSVVTWGGLSFGGSCEETSFTGVSLEAVGVFPARSTFFSAGFSTMRGFTGSGGFLDSSFFEAGF